MMEGRMKFSRFAEFLTRLEATPSRNEITAILAELFKESDAGEIGRICYLALGELVPSYRGLEFNIAEKLLIQILAAAFDMPRETILRRYKETGDLGDVAAALAKSKKNSTRDLSVGDVYDRLFQIAQESGAGSQERKISGMAKLIATLDPASAKFVTRIPAGKLRLGFSDVTILDALSVAVKEDKSGRPEIERAYNVAADIGEIADRVKRSGLAGLNRLEVKPGLPIRPALAERVPDPNDIIRKLGPSVAIEPKFDGFRTQIHVWREKNETRVALFSRNLENTTPMFPEIVASAKKLGVQNVILDGETIGYDTKTGTFSRFQETVQRKRKHGIEEMAKKVPLSIFVFDVLYADGTSLLQTPFAERRKVLEKILPRTIGAVHLVGHTVTDDPKAIETELAKAVKAGLEGLVIKNLRSHYEAGSRGFHWVKFKPTTAALGKIRGGAKGLPDTIDCVLMGAYKGRGKRAKFGVGGFLLGVPGKDGKFYTITRLGTGLSDEDFRETFRRIKPLTVKTAPAEYVVAKETVPDMWVRPSLVLEILADEITLSPRHTAGRVKEPGYSLRFPRLVRFRDDKNPEDATRVSEVERLYKLQRS